MHEDTNESVDFSKIPKLAAEEIRVFGLQDDKNNKEEEESNIRIEYL